MDELIANIIGVIFIGVFAAFGWWYDRRQKRRFARLAEGDVRIIEHTLNRLTLKDPVVLDDLRGKVTQICVMRNAESTGGEGGGMKASNFTSFIVDVNGESYDIEESKEHASVVSFAKAVASSLDVPFVDTSYGTF